MWLIKELRKILSVYPYKGQLHHSIQGLGDIVEEIESVQELENGEDYYKMLFSGLEMNIVISIDKSRKATYIPRLLGMNIGG